MSCIQGNPISLLVYISTETFQAKREQDDILNIWRREKMSTKKSILQSWPSEMKDKSFPTQQKLRKFIITRPSLSETLKRVHWVQVKGH